MITFEIKLLGNDESFRLKEIKAQTLLQKVWNSEEFKQAILNKTHIETQGRLWWKKEVDVKGFTSTNDTNEQVYACLMSTDHLVIQQQEDDCPDPSTVGYEQDGDPVTYVCKAFTEEMDEYDVANNAAHELCHSLGYHHSSATDYDSVPYFCGNLVEQLAKQADGVSTPNNI